MSFCNCLLTAGGRKKAGLSPKTVLCILSILKSIFRYAAQIKKYQVADIQGISVKQTQKAIRIFSRGEQQKLNRYLCNNPSLRNLGILVCLYTGLRLGEICALTWGDVLREEQCLSVRRTMQRIQRKDAGGTKTAIRISAPKSDCSVRKIPLPDEIFHLLISAEYSADAFFLTGQADRYIEPRTMQNHFKAVIKACGVDDANFHALRHTFATRCIELGFDVKSLSEILGHSSVTITLNRYVHPSMELKQKNMNMLSELFAVK